MKKILAAALTIVALQMAAPAHAGTESNGIWPNGVQFNGIWPNGVVFNGLRSNGLKMNGLWPNGIQANGTQVTQVIAVTLPEQAK